MASQASQADSAGRDDGEQGPPFHLLRGAEIQAVFEAAVAHLDAAASAIDAINVYPVPDGDTGSNMSATLREAVSAGAAATDATGAGARIKAVARGALYGARGNSGVILSQALRGFSEGTENEDVMDARILAEGLHRTAKRAYSAVAEPKEGTMLSVLRAAGDAAMEAAGDLPDNGNEHPCLPVLQTAIGAAEAAEAETINQLPQLREAGVTDSGGEGICTILRGFRAGILGEPVPETPPDLGRPIQSQASDDHDDDGYGFCTEFLLERESIDIDVDVLRSRLQTDQSKSVVVVGDEQLARIHVHTEDPDGLLDEARQWGKVSRVKVDDMSEQAGRFRTSGTGATDKLAVLALSRGAGFDDVFKSLGAMVADLGETVKPAAGDLARAADELRVPDVIMLPNHKNVLMSAEQAVELATATIHIVPSTTLAGGVAALVAYEPHSPVRENVEAMTEALESVRAVEVTIAAAARTTEGIEVRKGDALVLLDTKLTGTAETQEDALIEGLRQGGAAEAEIVTIYPGADADDDVAGLEERLAEEFPGVEIEVVRGDQSLYGYVASIEG